MGAGTCTRALTCEIIVYLGDMAPLLRDLRDVFSETECGDPSEILQDDNPRLRSVVNRAKLGFLRTLAWTASDPASSTSGRRC